ncbi:hypothetical protein AABB24_038498, partial [Solanum stoloniferum]
ICIYPIPTLLRSLSPFSAATHASSALSSSQNRKSQEKNPSSSSAHHLCQFLSLFSKITDLETRFVDFGREKSHPNLMRIKKYHITSGFAGNTISGKACSGLQGFDSYGNGRLKVCF